MLLRYQVRIRQREDVHTFALRLNALRSAVPDPKAARYRAALHLAIIRDAANGPRHLQTASMIGAVERA